MKTFFGVSLVVASLSLFPHPAAVAASGMADECKMVSSLSQGKAGSVPVKLEKVVDGLIIPWAIGFISKSEMLVTERPGRVRIVRGGVLQKEPVVTVTTGESDEGGLMGLALHPDFKRNRFFYIYYTTVKPLNAPEIPKPWWAYLRFWKKWNGTPTETVNRLVRYQLSADGSSAKENKILLDDIPSGRYHNGGRIKFGPDGYLYLGTGDGRDSRNAQDLSVIPGKILRMTDEGEVPPSNPYPGSLIYVSGVRNTQGFDWLDEQTLLVADHGPSFPEPQHPERIGSDELSVAGPGANLGWPNIYQCQTDQTQSGMITPSLVWKNALPPGDVVIYRGDRIPEWKGSLLIGVLGLISGQGRHLHRVMFNQEGSSIQVTGTEKYFSGSDSVGRIREVTVSPEGELYLSTSNCEPRGAESQCKPANRDHSKKSRDTVIQDAIYRVVRGD